MMYHTCRLPWRNSFPRSGSCCVSNNPRGFLYLSAGIAVIGKIGRHVRFLPLKKKKKKKELPQPSPAVLHRQPGPPDAALLQGLPFPSHLHPQPGPSDGILLQGLQLPVLLQGLQLPVLRLQIVGFPAHIAGPPVLGPRSARSCGLLRPL